MAGKKSINIDVETSVIKWAFESSGWTKEDFSKRLKITTELLDKWLSGEVKPTLKQLEDFSIVIKRPLAIFFLSEPPQEPNPPKDFRMLPDRVDKFDKKTLLAIRRARRLQDISKELSENLDSSLSPKIKFCSVKDDPKKIAEVYRGEFKFNEEVHRKAKGSYGLFHLLRELIEDRNILVFQISMPLEDARGFALLNGSPALIVVNSRDIIEARIFTLMHEFGHVILNEPGISIPENSLFINNIDKVEKWCNDFSSAFLLPEDMAKKIFSANKDNLTDSKTLQKLSNTYKLSKAMLLYNMHKLSYISNEYYNEIIDRFKKSQKTEEKSKGTKKGGFGAKADVKCLKEKGDKFVSLVANNIEKGFITHSDALSFLSIKLKSLDKVMRKTKK